MTDINVGAITEALNDKSDRDLQNVDNTAGADTVIEYQVPTAENNYTWYRKYKSGWVEQGGKYTGDIPAANIATITLPVTMNDTNYTILAVKNTDDSSSNYGWGLRIVKSNKTTATFGVRADSSGGFYWQVSGMAAV